jgi:leucyl-tRNA synthetase
MDPHNDKLPFSAEAERYWGPVDLYIGGASHAVLHLLYARFWHKVFFDIGLVSTEEPFKTLFNQGILTAPAYEDETERRVPVDEVEARGDGFVHVPSGRPVRQIVANMSKSLRNVINPDDVIERHGTDTFRLYEMFMSPLSDGRTWDDKGIAGCRRFLDRMWRVLVDPDAQSPLRANLQQETPGDSRSAETLEIERALNRMLKRVDDSFNGFNFNTAVSGFMTFLNDVVNRPEALVRDQASRLVRAMAPFAPHFAEEIWERLGHESSIAYADWPQVDHEYLVEDDFELVVQVLGKVRGRARAPREAERDQLEALARETVAAHLEGKQVIKTIVVPGRLVNFVVK